MENRKKVYDYLDNLGFAYQVSEHPAVYTIEEMEKLNLDKLGAIVKNLFLRDASGKRHFLVLMQQDKKVDLKGLQENINSKGLKFASVDRLYKYLGLEKGAVSPLGIINDHDRAVEVIIDNDLAKFNLLGVHPNDNRATVWLSFANLESLLRGHGNQILFIDI